MKLLAVIVALLLPATALAFEVSPHLSARGWFFSVDGTIENSDLSALDFDTAKGQPEILGGVTLGGRHHLDVSYLRVRRSERGVTSAVILGVVVSDQEIGIDLEVDYLRGHYGYSVLANTWIDLQPFVEVGWLREATDIRNFSTDSSNRQDDSAVFPLPGAELALLPGWPVHLRGRATGIGTGQGHLIDVQGGLTASWGFATGGLGYRHIDFRVENSSGREVANVDLDGIFIEGGVKFK